MGRPSRLSEPGRGGFLPFPKRPLTDPVAVQPLAPTADRTVLPGARPPARPQRYGINLHRKTLPPSRRSVSSARLRSSLLAYGSKASTPSGGADGNPSLSHRATFHIPRLYCEIEQARFPVIISARDNDDIAVAFCLRLPSDSASRRTALSSGQQFPLSGVQGTRPPKWVRPAGRTKNKADPVQRDRLYEFMNCFIAGDRGTVPCFSSFQFLL